jgi:hypothetical protein
MSRLRGDLQVERRRRESCLEVGSPAGSLFRGRQTLIDDAPT